MTDWISEWQSGMLEQASSILKAPIEVEGFFQKQMCHGQFARFRALLEPAERFSVNLERLPDTPSPFQQQYLQPAVEGFLDVFLTMYRPLRDVRITFLSIEDDPINSSQFAFREAGRVAAREVLKSGKVAF